MVVFLASEEEAQRLTTNRLVEVGGQVAFASVSAKDFVYYRRIATSHSIEAPQPRNSAR